MNEIKFLRDVNHSKHELVEQPLCFFGKSLIETSLENNFFIDSSVTYTIETLSNEDSIDYYDQQQKVLTDYFIFNIKQTKVLLYGTEGWENFLILFIH